jgi:hypothetical protein
MTTNKVVEPKLKQAEFVFTESHQLHLDQIKLATCDLLERKYKAGVQAYQGTKLWNMPLANLIENSIEESIDQITYLLTIRQTCRIIMELAHEGMNDDSVCATTARENARAIWYCITGKDK